MNSGFPLGRLFGTEIRAHWTWVFLLALITVVLGEGLAAESTTSAAALWGWGAAVVTAILVFASVAAHELAHVLVARRSGIGGNVVVIQLLGGSYLMESRPRTWGQELKTTLAGPIVSLVLLAVFVLLAVVTILLWGGSNDVPDSVAAVSFVSEVLALFNFFMVVTNLIPGYPMDGARIVHAIAWARSGRDDVATRVASRVGRVVGGAIMALGVVVVAFVDLWPGLALIVTGWLVIGSSRILDRRLFMQALISGALVSDAADTQPARIPPQLTLDVFAGEYLGERIGSAALVERGDELVGLLGTAQIKRIPRRNWPLMRTEQAMVPIANVPHVLGDSDLWAGLEIMERAGLDGLLIGTGEQPVSLLTRRSASLLIRERIEQRAVASGPLMRVRRLPGRPPNRPPWAPVVPSEPEPPAPPATEPTTPPTPSAGPADSTDTPDDDAGER
jgi:Zn-dependent protease